MFSYLDEVGQNIKLDLILLQTFLVYFLSRYFVVISEKEIRGDITSIRDFFRYLLGEGFLKTRNVIILQYLMRAINRPDLEEMCVKYATEDKQALCYYEDPKSQGDY